jgi:hypothetical protein
MGELVANFQTEEGTAMKRNWTRLHTGLSTLFILSSCAYLPASKEYPPHPPDGYEVLDLKLCKPVLEALRIEKTSHFIIGLDHEGKLRGGAVVLDEKASRCRIYPVLRKDEALKLLNQNLGEKKHTIVDLPKAPLTTFVIKENPHYVVKCDSYGNCTIIYLPH